MSKTLQAQGARLSDKAMELACHAREVWTAQPEAQFHAHTNRAMLELIFKQQIPNHECVSILSRHTAARACVYI